MNVKRGKGLFLGRTRCTSWFGKDEDGRLVYAVTPDEEGYPVEPTRLEHRTLAAAIQTVREDILRSRD